MAQPITPTGFELEPIFPEGFDLEPESTEKIELVDEVKPSEGKLPINPDLLRGAPTTLSGMINSRDPGVDYFSGVQDLSLRADFSRMDTDKERRSLLNKTFGAKNVTQDSFGAWVINPEGLDKLNIPHHGIPVAFDEQMNSIADIADLRGDAPVIAGGIVAGLFTGSAGFWATLARMGLTGLGAGGGQFIDDMLDAASGENLESNREVVARAGKTFFAGAAAEGTFGLARAAGGKLLAPEAKRMTAQTQGLVSEAKTIGAQPNVSQITDAPILGRMQAMMNRIFGNELQVKNSQALFREANKLKERAGPRILRKADIGERVSASIVATRRKFSNQAKQLYDKVDELSGGQPIVPTNTLKLQARQIIDEVPKTTQGKPTFIPKELTDQLDDITNLPPNITTSQMQVIRGKLFDNMQTPDLLPGIDSRTSRRLFEAAGQGFDDVATSGNPKVAAALKRAQTFYAKGIKKFDDRIISRITRAEGKPGAIDPDEVADIIFKKGNPNRIRKVKAVMNQKDWQLVRRQSMENILKKMVRRGDDPRVKLFDGKALLTTLDDFERETLDEMFGKTLTNDLYRLGRVMQLVTKENAKSGGLVAAHIALHPIKNLPRLTQLRIMSNFMNSKAGVRWLTDGVTFANSGPKGKAFILGVGNLTRAGLLMAHLADQETGVASITVSDPQNPATINRENN